MDDPYSKFAQWFTLAQEHEYTHPNACALATIGKRPDGSMFPDIRIVLVKLWDAHGFVFYTNHESAKGKQLAGNPAAALNFHWKTLQRQVRVRGKVALVPGDLSDAYFASRPRDSQISAWASPQSQTLAQRADFEVRLQEFVDRFPQEIPRPPFWGGYRLMPDQIEFWEEREGRQHHRHLFTATAEGWTSSLLYP